MTKCTEELELELRGGGLRRTKQREAILEALRGTQEHPDAAWVYRQVCRRIPNISLGTVYRNLGLLEDQGLVRVLRYGRFCRYDGNVSPHYHLACLGCGAVYDLFLSCQDDLRQQVEQMGYRVVDQRVEFYGYCPACLARSIPDSGGNA